jgi:hypothetical protein
MSLSSYQTRPTGVGVLPRGAKYSVKDLGDSPQGYMDMVRKELGVSRISDRPWVRWTQLHELTHIQHSRALPDHILKVAASDKTAKVVLDDVLAAEDARVNTILTRAIPDAGAELDYPHGMPLRGGPQGYIASWGAPAHIRARTCAGVSEEDKTAIDIALEKLAAGPLTPSAFTVEAARLAARIRKGDGGGGKGEGGEEKAGGEPKDSKSDKRKDSAAKRKAAKDAVARKALDKEDASEPWKDEPPLVRPEETEGSDSAVCEWSIPEVTVAPLTIYAARPGTHDRQATDTGVQLADVCRASGDGMIFSHSRRRPGTIKRGTFLIDGSGSMRLSSEDVAKIVRAVPAATVAIYDGEVRRGRTKSEPFTRENHHSRIVIVAQGGKMADLDHGAWTTLGGNTCDGPALLWLSRQPGPRIWYCDAGVTDWTDHISFDGLDQCHAIVKAGHITSINPKSYYGESDHAEQILAELRKARLVR